MPTTSVTTSTSSSAYTETTGNTLLVLNGGSISAATIDSGGFLVVNGGSDNAATILAGATETVSTGAATGDKIYGVASNVVSVAATLTNEIVENGGKLYEYNSATFTGTQVLSGGMLILSGNTSGMNTGTTLIGGGTVELITAKATIGGTAGATLTFQGGGNELEISATISAGSGDLAAIAGFTTGDKIDMATLASATSESLAFSTSGGNTQVNVLSGTTLEDTFIFAGTTNYSAADLSLTADAGGHAEIVYVSAKTSTTSVTTSTASGAYTETTGNTLLVLNGGSISAATIDSGAFLVVNGGSDHAATILAGGSETVSAGAASGDKIFGAAAVLTGVTVTGETVENGGTLVISGGAVDSASTILAGGSETVLGSATGDQIYGVQLVSAATASVSGETVQSGGALDLSLGVSASGVTVQTSGLLAINGNISANNTVLSGGGVVELESAQASLTGSLTFEGGGNTLEVSATTASGYGDLATICGFSGGDRIDLATLGSSAAVTLSVTTSGGNTVASVLSGGVLEDAFIFAGTSTYNSNSLVLTADAGNHAELIYVAPVTTSVTTSTASAAYAETPGNTLLVLNGGSVSAATIDNAAFLVVNGGADQAATLLAGGLETVSAGSASGDKIYGDALVLAGANVSGEVLENGGILQINAGAADAASTLIAGGLETIDGAATGDQIFGVQQVVGATATVASETVQDGGALAIGAGATANNIVLAGGATVDLQSASASLTGSLTFSNGDNTLDLAALPGAGKGEQAVIGGFSSTDAISISGVGANAALSFSTSGGNEVVTVAGASGSETLTFAGTATYTPSTLSLVTSGAAVDLETSVAPSNFNIQAYNVNTASAIVAGPLALYSVALDSLVPTQMNEGYTEVDAKAAAFDLFATSTALEADLAGEIEPVVIGPGGVLYLTDGQHTFTALADSKWGSSNPTVYINIVANYSNLTESQFLTTMAAKGLILPLNDDVAETIVPTAANPVAPIPTNLTALTNDAYRGLEYSILKNKNSKLFTTTSNIGDALGSSKPGLDKMTGAYTDFLEGAAYQDALGGLGLPYLSPGDIQVAAQWNLTGSNATTLPNVSGTVYTYEMPGFILAQNITVGSSIGNATLGQTVVGGAVVAGSMRGALDGNGTFTGITEINPGTAANPIYIGTANIGFLMELGNDRGFTVTLGAANSYIGGTSILAGRLIIAGDSSLGAAPVETNAAFLGSLTIGAAGVPTNVVAAVQADNGIIFDSLTEGNGALTLGAATGGTFATSRPIAIGSEAATIDVNDNIVTLNGSLVTFGDDSVGLGQTAGFSPLTIDDLSSGGTRTATAGTLILSTASPDFYGDIVIGNVGAPTVEVMNDAAMGYNGPNAELVGAIELNGGTLQTGASFSASERNVNVEGGSQIDVDGNATSWGSLTDVKRTLAIGNSSTTAGAISFENLTISQTSILQLDGAANGTIYAGAETVTFTNGILQTDASDTLVLNASSANALGTTQKVFSAGASVDLVDGIAPVWIVTNEGGASGAGPYDFVTYGANGYVQESGAATTLTAATGASVVELAANVAASGNLAAYALNTGGKSISLGAHTLTIGDGVDAAGLILASGSAITGGTLAFGSSEGVIWLSGTNPIISSEITGSNGLTFAGSGAVTLSTAANVSGAVTIDSGAVTLSAANIFAGDLAGVDLGDVKSKPSNAILDLTASQTFATLDSVGSKSAINIAAGDTLTIGDAVNNESSTLSSTITNATATAAAIVTAGSGLVDLSGATLTLVAGSTIDVTDGELLVATGGLTNSAVAGSAPNFVLSNGAQLQFAQSEGQYAGSISGAGSLDLLTGTLQLTGTNSYSGDTVLTMGVTLDVTTANLPVGNDIVTASGSLVDFDQTGSGAFGGVISGTGSLDKDDSATDGAGNVSLTAAQTYTGATYVEAGQLTLGVANAVAASSGAILGRVGGGATATLALGANETLASLSSNAGNATSVALNGNVLTLDVSASVSSDFGGAISGAGSLAIDGAGDAELSGANTFSGGATLDSGILELGANNSAGTGAITFASAQADLQLDATLTGGTTVFANALANLAVSDEIDLAGLSYVSGATTTTVSGSTLTVSNGTASETFTLSAPATANFSATADTTGGVLLTAEAAIAPTISNAVAGQKTTAEALVTPFAGVTIADANNGGSDRDTLTITVGGVGGALTGSGLSGSNGVYSLSGSAAQITSELEALSFIATAGLPNTTSTSTFALSDVSSAGASPAVNTATTVIDSDPLVIVNVAQFVSGETTLNKIFGGFAIADAALNIEAGLPSLLADASHIDAITASGAVSVTAAAYVADQAVLNKVAGGFAIVDTAADIGGSLNAFTDASITAITVSNNASVAAAVAQVTSDATTLASLVNANGSAYQLAISDTAADIENGLGTLVSDASHIGSINVSGGTAIFSATTFAADETTLNKIVGGFAIADTAANVSVNLTALQGDVADISAISFTDASAPTLKVTAAQLTADAGVLAKITSPYILDEATGANASSYVGYGNGLTFAIGGGTTSAIKGGGLNETFDFSAGFTAATISNFATVSGVAANDKISLATSDFGNWATLLADAQTGAAGSVAFVSKTSGASLTLAGVTLSAFESAETTYKAHFAFHA